MTKSSKQGVGSCNYDNDDNNNNSNDKDNCPSGIIYVFQVTAYNCHSDTSLVFQMRDDHCLHVYFCFTCCVPAVIAELFVVWFSLLELAFNALHFHKNNKMDV